MQWGRGQTRQLTTRKGVKTEERFPSEAKTTFGGIFLTPFREEKGTPKRSFFGKLSGAFGVQQILNQNQARQTLLFLHFSPKLPLCTMVSSTIVVTRAPDSTMGQC